MLQEIFPLLKAAIFLYKKNFNEIYPKDVRYFELKSFIVGLVLGGNSNYQVKDVAD